jgi:hypothetical protein
MTQKERVAKLIKLNKMQYEAGRAIIAAALRTKHKDPRAQALCDHYRAARAAIREQTVEETL